MSVNNPDIKRMTIYNNKGIICKNMPLYRNKSDKISIGIKKWKNFKKIEKICWQIKDSWI